MVSHTSKSNNTRQLQQDLSSEDLDFILRDLADCRKQLSLERQQSAKLRCEKKDAEDRLEKVAQSGERWMLRALEAMRESQLLREEKLGINVSATMVGAYLRELAPSSR